MPELGRLLVALGVLLIVVGGIFLLASRLGLPLGRLPGDILIQRENLTVYLPLGTCILLSVLISLAVHLFRR